jgi:soluble lytic murein transglycosylase-like protein
MAVEYPVSARSHVCPGHAHAARTARSWLWAICCALCLCAPFLAAAADQAPNGAKELVIPPPGTVSKGNKRRLKPIIDDIARAQHVDPNLVNAVIAAESGYNPAAVSRKGAIGLMQIMPATAADYGVDSPDALFDPKTNVTVGARHLRRLLGKYQSIVQAVSAYNAGEGVLDRDDLMVKYPETQRYTLVVISNYWRNSGKKVLGLRRLGHGRSWVRIHLRIPSAIRNLNPSLHAAGPDVKPMFVLEPPE